MGDRPVTFPQFAAFETPPVATINTYWYGFVTIPFESMRSLSPTPLPLLRATNRWALSSVPLDLSISTYPAWYAVPSLREEYTLILPLSPEPEPVLLAVSLSSHVVLAGVEICKRAAGESSFIPTLPLELMRTFSCGAPLLPFATFNVNAPSAVDTLLGHLSLPLPPVSYTHLRAHET